MFEFKLPDLGEGIHEGEILKWHVKAGDTIREDEPLVDVETDKAAVTIPSPRGGRIVSVTGGPGDTVKVGQVITVIEEAGTAAARSAGVSAPVVAPAAPARAAAPPSAPPTPAPSRSAPGAPAARSAPVGATSSAASVASVAAPQRPAGGGNGGPVPAAPATRRKAREMGIDINMVAGSGPGGRVTVDDLTAFAKGGARAGAGTGTAVMEMDEGPAGSAVFTGGTATGIPFFELEPLPDFEQWGPVEREPVRSIRRKVARKMVTSTVLIPHVGHADEADVTDLEAFRLRERARREGQPGGKLTLLAFVVKVVADCLQRHPKFNASLDPFRGEIVYKKFYHIGIAVDSGRGLIVPVVKNADRKNVLEIAADIEDLAGRARAGKIEVSDLQGGTFTITNVGPMGGMGMMPTINYPEVAILGMGKAQPKPVVRDGQIVARTMLPLAISYDHRVADGADGGRFVADLVRRLSDPYVMLLEG